MKKKREFEKIIHKNNVLNSSAVKKKYIKIGFSLIKWKRLKYFY